MQLSPKIELVAENSLLIRFSDKISLALPEEIARCRKAILREFSDLITDTVPSYNSLLVYYNFRRFDSNTLANRIHEIIQDELTKDMRSVIDNPPVVIPVYYDTEVGWDLESLAEQTGLSIEQVITIHSQTIYLVCAIGFAPGFAYMGFVNPQISCARLASPRAHVPKGSVGIANQQTGIYPKDSPGGWNIIGRTPFEMFDSKKNLRSPCPVEVGDTIKFKPIDRNDFLNLGGELN